MLQSSTSASRLLWRLAAGGLIALGVAISAYLLGRHFAIAAGVAELFDICKAMFGGDCNAAIKSEWAVQLGIPLAGWGLVHFAMVAVALLLARCLGETFVIEGTLAAALSCTLAATGGVVLTGVMLWGPTAFCTLCAIVHAINLLLIPMILLASGRTMRELRHAVGGGLRYLVGADVADPIAARWKGVGLVTVALVGIVTYQWILIQADRRVRRHESPATFEQVLKEFEAGAEYEIPVGGEDPRLGDEDAPLQLVLFSDFQCSACRRYARFVAQLRERYPQVAVIFKHYPLSKNCNRGVSRDLHPLSCAAAHAAEAARRQGKFWEYHDALFASTKELEASVLRQLAQDVGLETNQFEADLADAETKAKVHADTLLGNKLHLAGTPAVFLKNKMISASGMSRLDQLIEHELHERSHSRD